MLGEHVLAEFEIENRIQPGGRKRAQTQAVRVSTYPLTPWHHGTSNSVSLAQAQEIWDTIHLNSEELYRHAEALGWSDVIYG